MDLGQYLSAGDPIVPLQAVDPLYVNFAVPQQDVPRLRVGSAVKVTAEGLGEEFTGRITALDSVVDPQTRNVQVQATLPNQKGRLRPGHVRRHPRRARARPPPSSPSPPPPSATRPTATPSSWSPSSRIPKGAKYRGVKQQFVKLGPSRGDQVAVISGLEAGQEVVTSGAFKLRNGAAVRVSNDVPMSNDPAPRPENN